MLSTESRVNARLGESGLSPVQPLVSYRPGDFVFTEVTPTASYSKGDLSRDGSVILINNSSLYNRSFSLIGTLAIGQKTGSAALAKNGEFAITNTNSGELYWYDTSNLSGQTLNPTAIADLNEDVGRISEMILSDDGLTLFVLGTEKMLVIPVWQIKQNLIGYSSACPLSGCNGIAVAEGVSPSFPLPADAPEFDSQLSTAKHISPVYAGVGHQFEVIITGAGFTENSVVMFDNTPALKTRFITNNELRTTPPSLAAGTYTVTVDGHQLNAPEFSFIEQPPIVDQNWLIGGTPREVTYDAINHALYMLDTAGKTLYRIDLHTNQVTNQAIANATDMTWCAEDDAIYIATGTDVRQYQTSDLSYVKTLTTIATTALECVSEGNLIITAESQWEKFSLFDIDAGEVAFTPNRNLYSPMVDGVSSKGDRVMIGESGITSPDRAIFVPHLKAYAIDADGGTYNNSHWSDDGSLGVINNTEVHYGSMSRLGDLRTIVSGTIQASAVSPDASAIYSATSDGKIHKILIDPVSPDNLSVAQTYSLTGTLGTIKRIDVSLDGKTVFVAGTNSIEAITIN